jgi:hypothetical protein
MSVVVVMTQVAYKAMAHFTSMLIGFVIGVLLTLAIMVVVYSI